MSLSTIKAIYVSPTPDITLDGEVETFSLQKLLHFIYKSYCTLFVHNYLK